MSKRAEEKAIDAWAVYEYREHPKGLYHTCFVDGYKNGYEQAEKETIKRAVKWMKLHTYTFENVEEVVLYIDLFRKAMEEE